MSGSLRQAIGPALAKLKRHMEEATSLRDEGSKSIVKNDFPQYNDKWLDILGRLQDDEKDKEESIYAMMVQNPEGMIQVLENARDMVILLQTGITEMEQTTKSSSSKEACLEATHGVKDEDDKEEPPYKLVRGYQSTGEHYALAVENIITGRISERASDEFRKIKRSIPYGDWNIDKLREILGDQIDFHQSGSSRKFAKIALKSNVGWHTGQYILSFISQEGPGHHRFEFLEFFSFIPRVAISA
uniref:Uncharacterized protein n=1 Tax=Syphacia muris TaxID=451379 RepID=A0A0N5ARF6_9BILA